jgi:stalled ribosome alternative rescue factor ArfA
MKITIKLKQPKQRNLIARAVLDPNGLFRAKNERDRTKYNRKAKHRNQEQ